MENTPPIGSLHFVYDSEYVCRLSIVLGAAAAPQIEQIQTAMDFWFRALNSSRGKTPARNAYMLRIYYIRKS